MPQDVLTRVTRNVDLGHDNFLLEFEAPPEILQGAGPAQFFMIGIPGAEPLLRRPFSICGLPGTFGDGSPGAVQVLYRVVGRGTTLLASLAGGAHLQVLGPLGRGFALPPADAEVWFVAGGIGSAPFPAQAAALAAASRPRPHLFYGARGAADLPLLDWFEANCERVATATEDGSRGERGLVTAPLERGLTDAGERRVRLQACGPQPMLRAVKTLAERYGVPCELSLEAPMACGFGVCLGCVVPTRGADGTPRYERVCVEGPVMPAERLAW